MDDDASSIGVLTEYVVTENGSFVAGMERYFDLIWAHDSVEEYPGGR